MKFYRKIYSKLLDWKRNRNRKTAILIEGARRVGKSFIVEEFARTEFASSAIIDFSRPSPITLDAITNHSHNLAHVYNSIALEYGARMIPGETVIVFDEVQFCPKARQLVKHLVADGRFHVIETGSLVTLKTNSSGILIPSEEERIQMHPMDFEEFCLALGDDASPALAKEAFGKRQPLGAFHDAILRRYREYLCVGGMPQAVAEYAQNRDLASAEPIKKSILALYRDDISKFAGRYAAKVRGIFDAIPGQLSKAEKRYELSALAKSARLRTYEDAFMWLHDAKVALPCFNATDPTVGMRLSSDFTTRKLYLNDTGLLLTLALDDAAPADSELYREIFAGDVYFNNGMIAENAAAQAFAANGRSLFYYSRRDPVTHRSRCEIDFLIRRGSEISPVEVKSGKYRKHSSLDAFCAKFPDRLGEKFIVYGKDLMAKDGITHVPFYMAGFL